MARFSMVNKLTAAVSVLLIITLSAMAYFSLSFFEARYKAAITEQEYTLLSAMGKEIDSKIENAHKMLIANAKSFPYKDMQDSEKIQAFLDSRHGLHTIFDSHLFLFSPEGKIIAESPFAPDRRGLDVSYRDYIQVTVNTGEPYISEPYISTQKDRQPAIMFTAPIYDENHRLIAVFAGSLNLLKDNFIGNLAATKIGNSGYVYMYNKYRTMIIHPERDRILEQDVPLGSNYLFDKAIHGFEGSGETVNSRGLSILASFKQLKTKDWILAANHPLDDLYAPLVEVKTYFLVFSLLGILGILSIIRFSLKYLTDPLIALTQHVQTLSGKAGTERLCAITSDDEIGALSQAFNAMISELDSQKQTLMQSEALYRTVADFSSELAFLRSPTKDIRYISPSCERITGYTDTEFYEQPDLLDSIVHPDDREAWLRDMQPEHIQTHPLQIRIITKSGEMRWISHICLPVFDEAGQFQGFRGSQRDITARKQAEEQLRYLSLHDTLTGLYDRSFFEQENLRLSDRRYAPVGMVICDIDGLKLVNDTLGHIAGDKLIKHAAQLIKGCFRETDILARIGGDEFAIILPNSSRLVTESACQRVSDAVFQYNLTNPALPLSISIGYAIGDVSESCCINDLFREADDNMYREKLAHSQDARQSIIQAILREARNKDFLSDGHGDRIQDWAEKLAERIVLPKSRLTILRRLAIYHDIGKVGITDEIVFKPGPLTSEEMAEMRRHPDIGRRIAQSVPELSPIADLVWKHHEWWNGSGYPLGLKHEEIPLECRILAIVEAYDVMTHHQPYRSAMSETAAKAELERCAGSQFDPELVSHFIALLDGKPTIPDKSNSESQQAG